MVRCILTSLACKYRLVLERLELVTGRNVQVVHVVGGGELGSLRETRELAGASATIARYEPSAAQLSHETYERFLAMTGLESPRATHAEGSTR